MSFVHDRLALLLTSLLVASCGKELNPAYCAAHPDDVDCARDGGGDGPTDCTSDDGCAAPTSICDLPAGVCVQCTPDRAEECTGTTPVCADDRTCRGCTAHAECASSACQPDGACAPDTDVAYVDAAGSDTPLCTLAMPCTSVADALATRRPFIKLTGTVDEGATIRVDDQDVTFLASPGAKLTRDSTGVILEIRGTSHVSLVDLEISGALGASQGLGISIPPGANVDLALLRARILNNQGGGISASGGSLSISQSTLSGNQGGGISAMNSVTSITNSFIHHNGNTVTASFGGMALRPVGASTIELNTIVDNQANLGAASAGGVFCDVAGQALARNLIFRNTGGATGTTQVFGNCTYGDSFVAAGASATDNSPGFVSPNVAPFDYHLTASSPTTVRDAAGACAGIDFDGDTRPAGAACDLGADEVVP